MALEKDSPPLMVAGLPMIVPTFVSELVTSAFTVSPARSSCVVTHLSVVGWSRAASTRIATSGANVFVVKLLCSGRTRTDPP